MSKDVGRNDPCPCGSGKKYKSCCMGKNAAPRMTLAGRKFTAKVLSGPGAQKEESKPQQQSISVDYNTLMERSFGEALRTNVDKPPIPEHPEDYLA